jgi:heme-degrading monooxygenase HmoA
MSVFMMLTVAGDPDRLPQVMADESRWQAINERAKANGAIHHRFLKSADGGTICVFDEWESEAGFHAFFQSSPEIPQLMAEAGVTSEPKVAFWHTVDTPDAF